MPPLTDTIAEPLLPEQVAFEDETVAEIEVELLTIVAEADVPHPFASVMLTEYVPAATPEISLVVEPVDQE